MIYLCNKCNALNKYPNDEEKVINNEPVSCQRCQAENIPKYMPFSYAEGTKVTDKDGVDITKEQEDDMNIMAYQSFMAGAQRMQNNMVVELMAQQEHNNDLMKVNKKIILPGRG